MPEFPDITVYVEAIERRVCGSQLREVKLQNPFLLRTVLPPVEYFVGQTVVAIERMGKRIVIAFARTADKSDVSAWMVLHLMIAGRLHWKNAKQKPPGKNALLILRFDDGFLYLTEAGSKRRASLHLFDSAAALEEIDPNGLEVFDADFKTFCATLTAANHTLKRALTDPNILSGIGNAYSDEILHCARLSPFAMTQNLSADELQRLFGAIKDTLEKWVVILREHYGESFPEKVTAFREEMAAHGRFGKPCPVCESPIQRIRYATNETNYCPKCQTGGKIFADRALSRLLKKDWPRTLEELEKKKLK